LKLNGLHGVISQKVIFLINVFLALKKHGSRYITTAVFALVPENGG
jgi:hypothetical protein